jgi:hypothetical protein
MSYIIPDPRFEMPELFTPARKPAGKTAINVGHPMARGLVTHCPFSSSTPVANIGSYGVEAIIGGSSGITRNGRGYYFDDSSDDEFNKHIRVPIPDSMNAALNAMSASGLTAVVHFNAARSALIGSNRDLVILAGSYRALSTAEALIINNSGSGGGEFQSWSGASLNRLIISSPNMVVGKDEVFAFSYDVATNNTRIAVNGVASNSDSTFASNDSLSYPGYYLLGTDLDGSTQKNFHGTMYSVTMWDRALSKEELLSVTYNPYQFLLPA